VFLYGIDNIVGHHVTLTVCILFNTCGICNLYVLVYGHVDSYKAVTFWVGLYVILKMSHTSL